MVSALSRKPSAKPRFLFSSCFDRFGAFIGAWGKKQQMTSYAAVDLIAQRTANTTEQGTAHTAEAPTSGSERYTSPARARIAIAYDGRSSGLSVCHRVGGVTRGASFRPSPSDTCFPDGSVINTTEFARRHFGMFVSRWNQTQVHAEGGPPSARCPRVVRWVLGDRGFDWNDVDFLIVPRVAHVTFCKCASFREKRIRPPVWLPTAHVRGDVTKEPLEDLKGTELILFMLFLALLLH